jgi:hypothetical protein
MNRRFSVIVAGPTVGEDNSIIHIHKIFDHTWSLTVGY